MSKPKIVCLCGSTKFKDAFIKANLECTLAGEVVLTVGGFRGDHGTGSSEEVWGEEAKAGLDLLHKWKVEMADRVLVLNVGGYVGSSTKSEIGYAIMRHKTIDFLEPESGEAIFEAVAADHGCIRDVMRDVMAMGVLR